MKLLADIDPTIGAMFGITPPDAMNPGGSGTAQQGLANMIAFGIKVFILIAGLALLLYLLWGAFDWITSGGEKEKIAKAQNKITNAVIGIILVFAVLMVFNLLAGDILKIIVPNSSGGGFEIKLPTL
jgi:magnesium-transporting ATPase (P-type)